MKKVIDSVAKEICDKYVSSNIKIAELAKLYKLSTTGIRYTLNKNQISIRNNMSEINRRYSLNENYFDKIDTEAKAYFLGLLYADGCVSKNRNTICISLQLRDKHILETLNNELKSNKPIAIEPKKKENWQNMVRLEISSYKMKTSLINHGCIPCKSKHITIPVLEPNLLRHFIRGYFDGDGSISTFKRKDGKSRRIVCNISSNPKFCENIKDVLKKIEITGKVSIDKRYNCGLLIIINMFDTLKFLNWIYKDSNIKLNRKFELFKNTINLYYCEIKGKNKWNRYKQILPLVKLLVEQYTMPKISSTS